MEKTDRGRLEGKVALITGGAGGFGAAMARRFAAEGAVVWLSDIVEDAVRGVAAAEGCQALRHDVTDDRGWRDAVATIERESGALHVVVNNAGYEGAMDRVSPEDTDLDDFRRVQAINFEGVFLGCRASIPALKRAEGGSIINISSLAALIATPFQTAYGASKAAVRHLTMSVAAYGAPLGIRCNSIHPGQMRTRMIEDIYAGTARRLGAEVAAVAEDFGRMIPMGRLGTAEDVANAAVYLASDEARYVTGAALVVDGGSHIV